MAYCDMCNGEGIIITCCDDICNGTGHCIHGDGEKICPQCDGEGCLPDNDDDGFEDESDDYKHPDPDRYISEDEEAEIEREEYFMTHGRCETCGGEYGNGWSNCECEDTPRLITLPDSATL